MPLYRVFTTATFEKLFRSLDHSEQQWIIDIKGQLEENPSGKPLHVPWFREKKHLNKRLYYLVDEQSKKILFLSFASKKEQQEIITFIRKNMGDLLNYLKSL